ncbi:MAG: response regulator [Polyangiaceae bacterium]
MRPSLSPNDRDATDPRGERVLEDARRAILRIARHVTIWIGLPTLALSLIGAIRGQRPFGVMLCEFVTLTGALVILWWDQERRPRIGAAVFVAGLLVATALALLQFGPLMGTGAMLLGWSLFAVFFYERVAVGLGGVIALCLGMLGLLVSNGAPRSWPTLPDGLHGFVRVALTVAMLTGVSTYAFARLLLALKQAINQEFAARAREQQARLEQAEVERALADSRRLEAVGQLAGGAAHDFNNVMTTISTNLYALRDAAPHERGELFVEIEHAVEMARATTRQLLAFAKQGSQPTDQAVPADSVATLCKALKRLFPESISVECDTAPTPRLPISSGEFEQALLNLALNARDAMPRGGTLTLRCRMSAESKHTVVVEVEDTGDGFVGDAATRAGEPFFTTKPRGTGLGLAMVKRTVASAKGSLSIQPREVGGTRVRLQVPCADMDVSSRAPRAPASKEAAPEPLASASVLVLEDEPQVRRAIDRVICRVGCRVIATATVSEALAKLDEHGGFDLLLTDASLPDGDAGPVIERCHARRIPVIVCSGHMDVSEVLRNVEVSSVVFMQKPFQPAELMDGVRRILRRESDVKQGESQSAGVDERST